jgi:isochorismate synthase EntC
MQCFANGFRLFAGGGIVAGSDPAKEWKETRDKIESIRAGIGAQ